MNLHSPHLVVFGLLLDDGSNVPHLLPQILWQGLQQYSSVVPTHTHTHQRTVSHGSKDKTSYWGGASTFQKYHFENRKLRLLFLFPSMSWKWDTATWCVRFLYSKHAARSPNCVIGGIQLNGVCSQGESPLAPLVVLQESTEIVVNIGDCQKEKMFSNKVQTRTTPECLDSCL